MPHAKRDKTGRFAKAGNDNDDASGRSASKVGAQDAGAPRLSLDKIRQLRGFSQRTRGSGRGSDGKRGKVRDTGEAGETRTVAPIRDAENRITESGERRGEKGTTETTNAKEIPEGFEVVQAEDLKKSDRPKRKYTRRQSARTSAISDDAILAASILVGVLDSAAQAVVSPDAALTLNERNLIEEPLSRIMDRLSPEMTEKIQTFSDPILLAFGLGLWSMRLYKINRDKKESEASREVEAPKAEEPTTETPKEPDNGNMNQKPLKPKNLMTEVSPI